MSRTSPAKVLAVLSLAAFMASLDLFIVNVAFEDIGRDFGGVSLGSLSWVLNGYAIVYAAMLVPLGRLADRFGQKAGFLVGLAVFTLASAACAASDGLVPLVTARLFQAFGAALLTPTSMGLLLHATKAEGRARAVRIWAATGAIAAAAGPVVGGLLVRLSWKWVFLVNLPVGVIALAAAARLVPDGRREAREPLPDLVGAGWLTVAISALSLALVKAPEWGALSIAGGGTLLSAAFAGAVFVARSRRHPSPVVEPSLLSIASFRWANLTALVFSIGFAANLLANVLWMQGVWRYSALRTGLAIFPGPMMVPLFAAIGQRLARRMSAAAITSLGCVVMGAGAAIVLLRVGPEPSYTTTLLPGWLVAGAGVGLAMPTMLSSATADLPPSRAATGSAVVNMARQVGSVLGVSLLVALVGHPVGYEGTHAAFVRGWLVVVVSALVGAAAASRISHEKPAVAPAKAAG